MIAPGYQALIGAAAGYGIDRLTGGKGTIGALAGGAAGYGNAMTGVANNSTLMNGAEMNFGDTMLGQTFGMTGKQVGHTGITPEFGGVSTEGLNSFMNNPEAVAATNFGNNPAGLQNAANLSDAYNAAGSANFGVGTGSSVGNIFGGSATGTATGNAGKHAARNGWVDGSMIALTGYGAYNENENAEDALKEQKKVNKHNMRLADNAETRRAEMDVGNEAGFGLAMEDARKRARRQKTVG